MKKSKKIIIILVGLLVFAPLSAFAHMGGPHSHHGHKGHHGYHRPPIRHHHMMPPPRHFYHPPIRTYYSPYPYYNPYYSGISIDFGRHLPIHSHGILGAGFHISI